MAVLKKNQVNQILFCMVDKTDFATLETSLASSFTVKRFGVNHGSAACNVSTLSRAVSKVGSGIYRLSLEANACNYDYIALRIAHASAATQMLVYEMRTYDDTDTFSQLSDIGSNLLSYLAGMSGVISDVYSLLSDVNSNFGSRIPKEVANASQLLLMKSQLSDAYSMLSDLQSDFGSRVPKEIASKSLLSDVNSNLLSYLGGISNILSAVYVDTADISNVLSNVHADLADLSGIVSDFYSDFGSRVPKEVASKSLLSDVNSDLASQIGGITVTIGASDVSDIASAVVAGMTTLTPSDISDIASAVWAYGTRKITSLADVSLCASDMSDLRSAITAGGGALTDSNISDIASAVWGYATKEVALDASTMSDIRSAVLSLSDAISNAYSAAVVGASRALLNQSSISDIYSLLSDFNSNFDSRVPKEIASKSLVSDINSNLLSYLAGISDQISNVDSAINSQYSDVKSAATAIKAKTDNLQFTVGSMVDANLHYINDVSLIGDGGATPWGP